jgi:hypothetical protein
LVAIKLCGDALEERKLQAGQIERDSYAPLLFVVAFY